MDFPVRHPPVDDDEYRKSVNFISPRLMCFLLTLYFPFCLCLVVLIFPLVTMIAVYFPSVHDLDWLSKILRNCLLYISFLLPLLVFRYYFKSMLHSWKGDHDFFARMMKKLLHMCFKKKESLIILDYPRDQEKTEEFIHANRLRSWIAKLTMYRKIFLVFCALVLNASYILWGFLQERLMTTSYGGERFKEPQLLVLFNRFGALIIAAALFPIYRRLYPIESRNSVPMSEYAYPSLSNITSSWCQYESLMFVTFPTQVISKSCKIIPVMLFGWIFYGRAYRIDEYINAGVISTGVGLFLLSASDPKHRPHVDYDSISGIILLLLYLLFDSFTSTWQDNLFRTYKVPALKMMCCVNAWSVFFTLLSLIIQGTLPSLFRFTINHPSFILDASLSVVSSGLGQIFIFLTISHFGAVVFVIIMTVRQVISIMLSCIFFSHPLDLQAIVGIILTFGAIIVRAFISLSCRKS